MNECIRTRCVVQFPILTSRCTQYAHSNCTYFLKRTDVFNSLYIFGLKNTLVGIRRVLIHNFVGAVSRFEQVNYRERIGGSLRHAPRDYRKSPYTLYVGIRYEPRLEYIKQNSEEKLFFPPYSRVDGGRVGGRGSQAIAVPINDLNLQKIYL